MIKKLLLTAALLAPGLAYGQVPTTCPSPAPPGTTCSPLDPPVIPAPAAAAGFTTQVLNADFSQPSYANIANWIDGCGGPTTGYRWGYAYYGDGNRQYGQPSCSRITQEYDASVGKNVLHFQAQNGDSTYPAAGAQNGINLSWPEAGGATGSPTIGSEMYVKLTFRFSAASLTQLPVPPALANPPGQTYYVANYFDYTKPGVSNWVEPDMFEVVANSNTGSGWQWGDGTIEWPSFNGIWPPAFSSDLTAYHTISTLFTSDGTQLSKCEYLDGDDPAHKLGCWKYTATVPVVLTATDKVITLGIGNKQLVNTVDLYVQDMQVWMCANWQTQACIGTLVYP